jgi:hypothetical protein
LKVNSISSAEKSIIDEPDHHDLIQSIAKKKVNSFHQWHCKVHHSAEWQSKIAQVEHSVSDSHDEKKTGQVRERIQEPQKADQFNKHQAGNAKIREKI